MITELVLTTEFWRLDLPTYFNSLYIFAEQTRNIESDDRNDVSPSTSSAKGYYQFTDGALQTAYNRLSRYDLNRLSDKITQRQPVINLSLDEQTALFFANLFQQKGTDEYLICIIKTANVQAKKNLYAKFHHTNIDPATTARMDRLFV